MLNELDYFYHSQCEPQKSCFLALREIILKADAHITAQWKYRTPFFYYKGKMFCYLWSNKKTQEPYIGFVEGRHLNHPALEQGTRSRIKILRVDPNQDIDVELIVMLLYQAMKVY